MCKGLCAVLMMHTHVHTDASSSTTQPRHPQHNLVIHSGSGSSVVLEVGGTQESLYCHRGVYDIVLEKRKVGGMRACITSAVGGLHIIRGWHACMHYKNSSGWVAHNKRLACVHALYQQWVGCTK